MDTGFKSAVEGIEIGDTEKAFEDGKKAEYDVFWDALQDGGNLTTYLSKFRGAGWNNQTFKPKYSIRPIAANNIFSECKITNLKKILSDCGVEFDLSGVQYSQISQLFSNSDITDVGVLDVSSCTSLAYLLFQAYKLVNVDKIVLSSDGNTTFNNTTFQSCPELQEVRFEGVIVQNGFNMQWSKKLSKASITSVINALSTTTSGLIVTLSKTAKEAAFTADEWTALVNTRPNWTITLV
jgi:hypothetical protein